MKESIYTIPISEVFEEKGGCPLCRLRRTLEERWVDYITGAAMMEPDVRTETNRQGFCPHHMEKMLEGRNRLSVALMLQSRLEYLQQELEQNLGKSPKRGFLGKKPIQTEEGCFLCSRIDRELERILGNIAALWARDQEFRGLYEGQEYLCLPHYRSMAAAAAGLRSREGEAFAKASADLTAKRLGKVKEEIDAFCALFDYRSAGTPPPQSVSTAIESAAAYLTGETPPA